MIARHALVCTMATILTAFLYSAHAQSPAPAPAPAPAALETIPLPKQGKQVLNASGVVPIADSRFLIVDNRTNDALFEVTVGPDGVPSGPLVRRPLVLNGGFQIEDMEDLALADTPAGRFLFISTSLSAKAPKKSKGATPVVRPGGLIRIALKDTGPLEGEIIPQFRDWVIANYAKDPAQAPKAPDSGGLNVEGLAWDPAREALLLGIRSPVGDGVAYVVPVKLKNIAGPWDGSALEALPMLSITTGATDAPLGIRSIEYDSGRKAFLVLLGNAYSGDNVPFQLVLWDGHSTSLTRRFENLKFAFGSKPEGVSTGTVGGAPVIAIADDAGAFRVIQNDDPRLK